MKLRKLLSVAAGLSLLTLAACGGGDGAGGTSQSPASAAPTDISAELNYGLWDEGQRDMIQLMVDGFNKEYPNVKVNITVTPWNDYFTRLQTQASGGDLPDVFWLNSGNFELYASEGQLEPVGDLGIDLSVFPESLVNTYSYDGKPYGVPKDYDTIGLFYNEAIFKQAGVDVPNADWTWDDYHAAAKQISDAVDGVYGSIGGWSNQEYVYPMIYSYGGEIITGDGKSGYDSEAAVKTFKLLADMAADGSAPTAAFNVENWGTEVFGSAKAAMMPGGNWNAGLLRDMPAFDDIRVAPLPKGDRQATVIHGVGHVMSAKSSNKNAAAALLRYLGGKEAGQIQADSGGALPAYNGLADAYLAQFPTMDLKLFVDAADNYSFPMPASKNTAAWMDAENQWFPRIVGGEVTPEEGAKGLAAAMDKVLDEE